jgi:hypothetical protein
MTRRLPTEPHVERKPDHAGLFAGYPFDVVRMIRSDERDVLDAPHLRSDVGWTRRRVASGEKLVRRSPGVRIFL